MRTILVVRDDAERVASIPTWAELGSIIRAQNETATVRGGESAATRLLLGHVVTARPTNVVSEIRTIIGLCLTRVRESGRPEKKRKTRRKMRRRGMNR
jgi:hypothetical protein